MAPGYGSYASDVENLAFFFHIFLYYKNPKINIFVYFGVFLRIDF